MLQSYELWTSRFQRMLRRPPMEMAIFFVKGIKRWPNYQINKLSQKKIEITNIIKNYENKKTLLENIKNRSEKNFFFNPFNIKLKEKYKKKYPKEYKHTLKTADQISNNRIKFFNQQFIFENWHTINNNEWPLKYSNKIAYFGPNRKGDIKYIWELNRMQFSPILGKAYFLTENEKYAKKTIEFIESWINQNPYMKGINWMEGIEASIRIYSWIFSYYFLIKSSSLTPSFNIKILKSIYQHARFIKDFLSDKWLINNNHIIAELSALIITSLSFPEFKESDKWLAFSLKKLEKELNKQVLEDGCLWEHSTGYHKFVTELLIYPYILLLKNNRNYSMKTNDKLKKMFDFLQDISMNNNHIPLVGDEDHGAALKLNDAKYKNSSDLLAIGRILFNKKYSHGEVSDLLFWLFNGKVENINGKETTKKSLFKVFSQGGYGLFKSKKDYLLCVTSAQKRKYLHAGHRHMDMLSFIYEKNGETFIVDPGTYTYYSNDQMRNKFRGISMHNTIMINDENPSDLKGLFEINPPPKTEIMKSGTLNKNVNFFWARHKGYIPIIHNRIFIKINEDFIIYDFFDKSEEKHEFKGHLHIHPSIEIIKNNDKRVSLNRNNEKIWIISNKNLKINESVYSSIYGSFTKSKVITVDDISNNWESYFILSGEKASISDFHPVIDNIINKIINTN